MSSKLGTVFAACLIGASVYAPAFAAEDIDAAAYMARMKAALEPERAATRNLEVELLEPGEQPTTWKAWHAHERAGGTDKTVLVLTEPQEVRGVAHLIHQDAKGDYRQWVYLPFARRVRRIEIEDSYQPFMGSDFTLADLGLVQLKDKSFEVVGKGNVDGTPVVKIAEVPSKPWYYSKIVNWVASDSMLPLQRDYYTPGGQIWKVQRFRNITVIDGVPTPLRITMENKRAAGTTDLQVEKINYRDDIPDALFDPDKLRLVVENPFWATEPE